jgi:gluconate 5-dehydrogenase
MADQLFELKGKTALVTGSTSGIGKTMAEGLARNGVTVLINGRNAEKAETVKNEFTDKGYSAYTAVFDVTSSEEIRQAADRIALDPGIPDIIVNNAGINLRHPLEDFPEEEWDAVIDTNLKSAYLVTRAFIKAMIKRGSGKIINIGSLQSELGRTTITPYAASKGGIKMLTRGMATEWAQHNIQVNAIGPGYYKTPLTRPLYEDPEFDAWLKQRTPARRWGDPKELVGTLLFLGSAASDFVTGQLIFVDGGITASV